MRLTTSNLPPGHASVILCHCWGPLPHSRPVRRYVVLVPTRSPFGAPLSTGLWLPPNGLRAISDRLVQNDAVLDHTFNADSAPNNFVHPLSLLLDWAI